MNNAEIIQNLRRQVGELIRENDELKAVIRPIAEMCKGVLDNTPCGSVNMSMSREAAAKLASLAGGKNEQ